MTLAADTIRELAALTLTLGLAEVEVAQGDWSVRVRTRPQGPGAAAMAVVSPGVGTVLLTHPARSAPFVAAGGAVAAGDILALLACGPVLRPVTAPCAGTVGRVRALAGDLVDWGAPLFDIHPVLAQRRPARGQQETA